MLGIIGGTGICPPGKFRELDVSTPYGFALAYEGKIYGNECIFIPRHGKDHRYPPHKINYRANVWALKTMGVEGVLATYACGIISGYRPGQLIAAEDFIGFSAPITFYDDFGEGIKHFDFSEPFANGMRLKLFSAAKNAGVGLKGGGIVATTHGPRFETKAEVNVLKKMGANLVSMTNAYEATLLHELEIPLAGLCIGTNHASGTSRKLLSYSEVADMMARKEKEVNAIIREFVELL